MEKRYFFDKDNNKNWYLLPYDKRGEWSQWINGENDNNYDEYKISNSINEWSFENPYEITPEEPVDENFKIKKFNFYIKENIDFDDWHEEEIKKEEYDKKWIKEKYNKFINFLWMSDFDFYDGEKDFKKFFFKVLKNNKLNNYQKIGRILNFLDDKFGLYDGYDDCNAFLFELLEK